MKTIAVIDDDVYISSLISTLLEKNGYRVIKGYSGTEALLLLEKERPDLLLLDLMLPGLSGEEVLSRSKDIPVIVVSAKDSPKDKVASLMGGAVDYVSKPFDNDELLARIALRLRENIKKEKRLFSKGFELDEESREIRYHNEPLPLTRTEYSILKQLMIMDGNTLTKSALLERISHDTPDCTENSLKQHVSNLRKKIEKLTGSDRIENIWGVGFRLM